MVFLIIALMAGILGFCLWFFGKRSDTFSHGYSSTKTVYTAKATAGIIAMVIAGFLFALGSLIPTLVAYKDQINSNGQVNLSYKLEAIANDKSAALIPEFKHILAVQYPELEKEIFDKISGPASVQAYFAAYPQLQSSKTMTDLVARINQLRSDAFRQRSNRETAINAATVRKHNVLFLSFAIPAVNHGR